MPNHAVEMFGGSLTYKRPKQVAQDKHAQLTQDLCYTIPVTCYLEGHGDLVSILITPISHIVTPIIPIISLLTKSP